MSNVAVNPQTGEIAVLSPQGEWAPAQRARNPQTNEELFYNGTAWLPVPQPPPPAPSMGRSLGLGVRDAVQGLSAIPGALYDGVGALVNTATGALEAVGGPSLPRVRTAAQNIGAVADAAGLPVPETQTERMTSAIGQGAASTIPMIGAGLALNAAGQAPNLARMLTAQPVTQFVAGASGGGAQQAAAEGGAGPLAQSLANVAGGLTGAAVMDAGRAGGRLAASLAQPLNERGRSQIVGEALLRSSSQPETLAERLRVGLEERTRRLPASVPTLGTAARDPSLLRVESSVRAGALGPQAQALLGDADFARTNVRTQALDALADNSDPAARGAAVRDTLGAQRNEIRDMVRAAYQSVDPEGLARFPTSNIRQSLRSAIDTIYGPGTGGPPPELQRVLDDLPAPQIRESLNAGPGQRIIRTEVPVDVDWRYLQNLRSRLGGIAGQAARQGDDRLASAAGQAWEAVEDAALRQRQPAVEGLTERWQTAQAFRRQQGELFQRAPDGAAATGNILRRDNFGNPMLQDDRVPRTALRDLASVQQVLRAAGPQNADVRQQLRGQFVENLIQASRTTATLTNSGGATQRGLSIAQFNRFMDQNNRIARELFEPREYQLLQRIAADFEEGSLAANTGATRNSQTAQNLSVANLIARVTNGLVDADNPLARQVGGLGGLLRVLYSAPEQATRDMLTRAMAEPEFAQLMLSRATPEALERATAYLQSEMGGRVTQALQDRAARQVLRTGASPEAQSQEPEQQRQWPAMR